MRLFLFKIAFSLSKAFYATHVYLIIGDTVIYNLIKLIIIGSV